MSGLHILVVDDEPAIRRTLRTNLMASGYDVGTAQSGEEALKEFGRRRIDLVILDLMLPGMTGIEVCEAIRTTSSVPILVLSARGEEQTKVRALDLGADDYLTKPFGIDELLARVRAVLRRSPLGEVDADGIIQVGGITLNTKAHAVHHDGESLDLTPREYEVLAYLMHHAGKLVTHRVLLNAVWGPEYGRETHYLRVFINRLRRKVEDDPAHPLYIITEPGVGYRLVTPA